MEVKSSNSEKIITILSKKGTFKILNLLAEAPKRYNELRKTVSSDKTLSQRLKELESGQLIETISQKSGSRSFIHYRITDKAVKIMAKVKEL